jgi:SOS-response transcriptional repressor LexA
MRFRKCYFPFLTDVFKQRKPLLNTKDHFSERLAQAIKADRRTKTAIAAALGVHPPALSRWLRGSPPEMIHATRIAKELNINVQWLLTGEGGMRPEGLVSNARILGPVAEIFVGSVPVISWAHAGTATSYEELPEHWQDRIPTLCKGSRAFGLAIEGDSMQPNCQPGDIVTVDPDADLRNGCLVVVKLKNDGVMLRRFSRITDSRVRLIAYNQIYPSTDHDLKEFHWIYAVHSTFRREMI